MEILIMESDHSNELFSSDWMNNFLDTVDNLFA